MKGWFTSILMMKVIYTQMMKSESLVSFDLWNTLITPNPSYKVARNQYRYLEHGAMWAILLLAGFMWTGLLTHIPEAAIAVTSVAVLGAAFWHSHIMNRKDIESDNHA